MAGASPFGIVNRHNNRPAWDGGPRIGACGRRNPNNIYSVPNYTVMPKPGFKSITISETIYDKFHETFKANKEKMASKGVNSLAGYVTYMLEETMQRDSTFARHAPKLEKVSVDDDRVVLRDNLQKRIVEVAVQRGELYCMLCEEKDCVHIGFVWSLPDVYETLNSRGLRHK